MIVHGPKQPVDFDELVIHLKELTGDVKLKDLEKRAKEFSNNPLLPESVRKLIKDLWDAYSDARWVSELLWENQDGNRK